MRFGVREICNVVLRAKTTQYLGNKKFYKNEPVLYFDTLKTSSLEGASTSVYATGGRGNTRLVAWEGERTLTFTMEDALISAESFSILSGAGLMDATESKPIYQHVNDRIQLDDDNTIVIDDIVCWNKYDKNGDFGEYQHNAAEIFIMATKDGEIVGEPCIPVSVRIDFANKKTIITCYSHAGKIEAGDVVLVDYYVKRTGGAQQIEITADKFGGNYYLEASTLFRREKDGKDMPAEFIIPNCKVQSNFNFTMASTGDPSTFTFTMDAFPDYVKFDETHKVLAAIQVIWDEFDEDSETRQPCLEDGTFDKGENDNLEVIYDNDSTGSRMSVTVSGTAKAMTLEEMTEAGFGDPMNSAAETNPKNKPFPENFRMTTINVDLPVEEGMRYSLKTRSPMHEYYRDDNRIKSDRNGLYKEQLLNNGEAIEKNGTYAISTAITNLAGSLSFELSKVIGEGDNENKVLVKTITIKNNATLLPSE